MLHKRRTLTPEEAFTADIEAAIRRTPGVASVLRGEPLQLTVTFPSGRSKTVNLHNLFAETRHVSSAERALRIEQFVRASTLDQQVPEDWATASSQLMPSGARRSLASRSRARGRLQAPMRSWFGDPVARACGPRAAS